MNTMSSLYNQCLNAWLSNTKRAEPEKMDKCSVHSLLSTCSDVAAVEFLDHQTVTVCDPVCRVLENKDLEMQCVLIKVDHRV